MALAHPHGMVTTLQSVPLWFKVATGKERLVSPVAALAFFAVLGQEAPEGGCPLAGAEAIASYPRAEGSMGVGVPERTECHVQACDRGAGMCAATCRVPAYCGGAGALRGRMQSCGS